MGGERRQGEAGHGVRSRIFTSVRHDRDQRQDMEEKHDREEILDYIEIRGRTWSRSSIGRRDRT